MQEVVPADHEQKGHSEGDVLFLIPSESFKVCNTEYTAHIANLLQLVKKQYQMLKK